MPRLDPLDPDRMNPAQRRIHDAILAGPRGSVPAPLSIWLRRPELADRAQALGRYCRYETVLPPRLSELAILITAAFWRSGFEWHAHKPFALEAGLDPGVIEAIRQGQEPDFAHADEAALHAFARAVHERHRVPDAVYRRALDTLGEDGVVDLTGILGYYTLISMTLNIFEIPPGDGAPSAFD